MTRRSSTGADANEPIMGKWSRAVGAAATHESGGSDRGAQDPIPRVTQRPTQRGSGRSVGRSLGDAFVCSRIPIQGDLKLEPRSFVFEGGPIYAPAAAGRDRSAPVRDRGRRRRAGTTNSRTIAGQADEPRRGLRRSATRSPSAVSGAEAPGLTDTTDPLRWPRTRRDGVRAVDRWGPAACLDPTRPGRRWEPGLCVLFSVLCAISRPD